MSSRLPLDDLHWALQRRLEDVFSKLGEKFGDLTGRVETDIQPNVSFDEVGGLAHAGGYGVMWSALTGLLIVGGVVSLRLERDAG